MIVLAAVAPLILAVLAGALFGALRLFPDPNAAIAALNRLCLYLAFPALIFAGVYEAELAVAAAPGFVVASVLPSLVLLGLVALVTRKPSVRERLGPDTRAAFGIGSMLGNIAYLGIPISAALVGPQALGLASVAAALHIVLSIPLGSWVLLRWGRREPDIAPTANPLALIVRQPLVWAPILAVLAQLLVPARIVAPLLPPAKWIGAAASPVALVMIGLYLHTHRRELVRLRWADAALIGAKLVVLPALAFAAVWIGLRLGWLELDAARVVVVQAAMPTAITAFALAEEYGVGRAPLVRAIVAGTLVFMLGFWALAPVLRALG
jgi:malonate transporter and related proteins